MKNHTTVTLAQLELAQIAEHLSEHPESWSRGISSVFLHSHSTARCAIEHIQKIPDPSVKAVATSLMTAEVGTIHAWNDRQDSVEDVVLGFKRAADRSLDPKSPT